MTISSYSDLVTAVTEYLAREEDTTLIARIPTFIQLVEAKLNRDLLVRQMEKRATAMFNTAGADPEFVSLPDDFQSMRRIRLSSVDGKPNLSYMAPLQMDEYRHDVANISGRPLFFTIVGDELEFCPTPSEDYTIEMIYRRTIPALTSSNTTNWLLDIAPDAYLYGALLESMPYTKNYDRMQVWGQGFANAVDELNKLGQMSTYNAGPLQMRSSGLTP